MDSETVCIDYRLGHDYDVRRCTSAHHPDWLVIETDQAHITVTDPVGLIEQLTDALPAEEQEESSLVKHARHELDGAGLFDADSDYDGMLGQAALDIVKVFAGQGHSGASAAMVTDIVARLMRYEPLTPITDDPDEWMHVGDAMGGEEVWQCRRDGRMFSRDGGKTYTAVDDPTKTVHTAVAS